MGVGLYVGDTPIGKLNIGTFTEGGYDTSTATASNEHILSGKTAFGANGKLIGSMPDNGTVTKILDANNTSVNINKGYHSGAGKVSIVTEEKTVIPGESDQIITPTSGKVLSKVTVNGAPDKTTDATLTSGAQMLAPYTAYSKGTKYTGTIPSTDGGIYRANQTVPTKGKYLTSDIVIDVPASGSDTSDATLSSGAQMLNGVTAYSKGVKYTGNIPTNTSADLTTSGATVSVPAGYYADNTNKSVATAIQATPIISVDSTGLIMASTTQSAGYVESGTKSATEQLATQAGETVTVNKTLLTKGKYMTGDIVVNVPASGITPSGTIDIISNGEYNVTNYANANVNVPSTGIDTSDADAVETDIAYNKTAYVDGKKVTGSLRSGDIQYMGSFYQINNFNQFEFKALSAGNRRILENGDTIGVSVMKTDFGNAKVTDVLSGTTFTSENGMKLTGTYVPPEAGSDPVLEAKTVDPALTQQIVTPSTGYDGLSSVTVNAMPTATQATPTIDVSSSGLITASHTQSSGYVSVGTKSATQQLPTQGTKTVTPSTSAQTAVASGVYTTGVVTVAAMPNGVLNAPTINTSTGVVTAAIGTSGYLASGTSKTLNLTTKGVATINPTESTQTIAAGQYLTGTQTIGAISKTYVGSGVTRKSAANITPTENVQTIAANQYLTGVQTINAIPSDYIGSAVQVQNYYTGSTAPSSSLGANGDLYLVV